MISFPCPNCGMKFQVKTQFAGRSSRCPACKRTLIVPAPSQTMPVMRGQIDGTPSSVDRAKADGGVTLESPSGQPGQPSIRALLANRVNKGQRYVIEAEIARGGMGSVLRAVDCDIRREVAVKYLLDQTDPRKKLRFVEEAQITGQLEHPNIVPIHELGIDTKQRMFFSMKMVRGRSLAQVLDELRDKPRTAEKEYPLNRLLNILVGVCNALAYAHSRGVIHRDLKPANIMVGDFGEVYVMDWGLAKVLNQPEVQARDAGKQSVPASIRPAVSPAVATNRQGDADLTQDGAVLGTPVYMPPEQATGRVADIGPCSDVYSLGAILYEVLTLQPPIDKGGGYLAILMRVSQGEIVPPEQRAPDRARKGKVPRELSAIARKALATKPADRYADMEVLRRDIERFQEGRSVSAKDDTTLEMCWKLVKRNKAASLAAALAMMVLLVSMGFTLNAWRKEANASAALKKEKDDRQKQERDAVPSFVDAARMSADQGKFTNALQQLNFALQVDSKHAEAQLLKGQVMIAQGKFAEGGQEVRKYLQLKPNDADARRLVDLCSQTDPNNVATLLAIENILTRQNAPPALAMRLLTKYGKSSQEVRGKLLNSYRKRVEAAWPGHGQHLGFDRDGIFELYLFNLSQPNLAPLQGMALTKLYLRNCGQLRDLTALRGMPLDSLILEECVQVRDLTPLQGMPLAVLNLRGSKGISDFTPLRGLPLRKLDLSFCSQLQDLKMLRGMPLTRLDLTRCDQVRDLSPLQGMPLAWLNLHGCQVADLTPLQGMRLTELGLCECRQMRDLAALRGMKLVSLDLRHCNQLRDLAALKGMKLTSLSLEGCGQVWDVSPLQDMRLTSLSLLGCALVRDLSPLRGMPLTELSLWGCRQVNDLTPLRNMKLTTLNLNGCVQARDLTPVAETTVTELWFDPKNVNKGMDALRQLKTLKTVSVPGVGKFPVEEFWKRYDGGEFKK